MQQQVKYHKIILGDNPSVTDGAPITIHWKSHDRKLMDVDEFEEQKENAAIMKKNKKKSSSSSGGGNSSTSTTTTTTGKISSRELRLDVQDRAAILLGEGYSLSQIAKKTQEVHEIQRERQKTAASNVKWDGINEALESSGRVFRRLARLNLSGSGSGANSSANSNNAANPAA